MDDIEKMAWVSDRLDSDPRPIIASSFAACVVNNTSYNESMGIMLPVADAMPPETVVIRMASMTSFPQTLVPNSLSINIQFIISRKNNCHNIKDYQILLQ